MVPIQVFAVGELMAGEGAAHHLDGDAAPCMAGAKGRICGMVLSENPVLVRNTALNDLPAGFSLCCLDGDLVGWE